MIDSLSKRFIQAVNCGLSLFATETGLRVLGSTWPGVIAEAAHYHLSKVNLNFSILRTLARGL